MIHHQDTRLMTSCRKPRRSKNGLKRRRVTRVVENVECSTCKAAMVEQALMPQGPIWTAVQGREAIRPPPFQYLPPHKRWIRK